MNREIFLVIVSSIFLASCQKELSLKKIEANRIEISDSLKTKKEIEYFISPYRTHLDSSLNVPISYALKTYSKNDGELNTAIGNMMADAVMNQAGPIFENRSGKTLDFAILNHGGIRAIIPQGTVTTRTAYEVMPFENEVVVVGIKGSQIMDLITYLRKSKRAHPLSKEFQLTLDTDYNIISVTIRGKDIKKDTIYYVATTDYLYYGGDRMIFFQPNELHIELDYKIRNVLIDYFTDIDTLDLRQDDRFIRKKASI